jgi:hypothetical protein
LAISYLNNKVSEGVFFGSVAAEKHPLLSIKMSHKKLGCVDFFDYSGYTLAHFGKRFQEGAWL